MARVGWKRLVADRQWFLGKDQYPISAYSEFMPPPRVATKPYSEEITDIFRDDQPLAWQISAYEEVMEFRPGLASLGQQIVDALRDLGEGRPAQGLARAKRRDNPYWPAELEAAIGELPHEHYVTLMPLAFSRTQDDKGRVRWTLFGQSEQGPARGFWKSFATEATDESNRQPGADFLRRLLNTVFCEPQDRLVNLRTAGLR